MNFQIMISITLAIIILFSELRQQTNTQLLQQKQRHGLVYYKHSPILTRANSNSSKRKRKTGKHKLAKISKRTKKEKDKKEKNTTEKSIKSRSRLTSLIKHVLYKFLPKTCGRFQQLKSRIVNGVTSYDGAHPWIVSILKNAESICGGSIINKLWILTASHCFQFDSLDPKIYSIRAGSLNRNWGIKYEVEKLIMHERFDLDNMKNSDIALLKLSRPIEFGENVNTICLPSYVFEEPSTSKVTIAGWGYKDYYSREMPAYLQQVTLDRISDGTCAKTLKASKNLTIYKSQLCTWTPKKDACQGDSGGPAVEVLNGRAVQIGIVSYGISCADKYPGVYTQVSYFLDWINSQMELEANAKIEDPDE